MLSTNWTCQLRANASKHKAISYGQMEKKAEELEAEVKRLLAEDGEVEGFIATNRQKHGDVLEPAVHDRIPKDVTKQERMARKLRTKKGREIYSKRKPVA